MALTKDKYIEVADIITDIIEGKKQHQQETYHCGTAHCIAGWLEVNELKRQGLPITFTEATYDYDDSNWIDSDGNVWEETPVVTESDTFNWAVKYLGITESEGWQIFDAGLDIKDIKYNLNILAYKYKLI